MAATKEELAALTREELEAAVAYWEPKALGTMKELAKAHAQLRLYAEMAKSRNVWKRVRFLLKGRP